MNKLKEFIQRRHGPADIIIGLGFILCAVWAVYLNFADTVKMTEFPWGISIMLGGLLILNGFWHMYHAKKHPIKRSN